MVQRELQRTGELSSPSARTDGPGLGLGLDRDQEGSLLPPARAWRLAQGSIPCEGTELENQTKPNQTTPQKSGGTPQRGRSAGTRTLPDLPAPCMHPSPRIS